MIVKKINENKNYNYYMEIIKQLELNPDVIHIDTNQITMFFQDPKGELYTGELEIHEYNKIKKMSRYFKLLNELYVNSLLIKDEIWLNDLYSYSFGISTDKIRNKKIKDIFN